MHTMPARHKGETAAEHFWSRVERRGPDECWPHKNKPVPGGYVQVRFDGRRVYAHVLAYELTNGPVPDGHDLDHTCHGADRSCNLGDECPHRRCCNPAHGEPVTPAENNRRARYPNSAKTHCPAGHDYAVHGSTCNGRRHCRECNRLRAASRRAQKRAA